MFEAYSGSGRIHYGTLEECIEKAKEKVRSFGSIAFPVIIVHNQDENTHLITFDKHGLKVHQLVTNVGSYNPDYIWQD